MRIAFTLPSDPTWTGGINYLSNVMDCLRTYNPDIECILFVAASSETVPGGLAGLATRVVPLPPEPDRSQLLDAARVVLDITDRGREALFEAEGIDLIFQMNHWYGSRLAVPSLAWIPDFQHAFLPGAFSRVGALARGWKMSRIARSASGVLLSSRSAERDAVQLMPWSSSKLNVAPFAVSPRTVSIAAAAEVVKKYELPSKFFFFPAQLWSHKNHLAYIEALKILEQRGIRTVTVMTGGLEDRRRPEHGKDVLRQAESLLVTGALHILGLIPLADVAALMQVSAALVNPSLFEGWSTTVEEAKAFGVPRVLSNLDVHREQSADALTTFFDPRSPSAMADALEKAWLSLDDHSAWERDSGRARDAYEASREAFANAFAEICESLAAPGVRD